MGSNMQSFTGPERFMLPQSFPSQERFIPSESPTGDAPPSSPSSTAVYTPSMPEIAIYINEGKQPLTPRSEAETARQAFAKTMEDLERIAALGADWDSYGSAPPTTVAVGTARRLINTVYRDSLLSARNPSLPFSVAPLSGGGIQLEWRGETNTVEVEIGPEGAFGYLLIKGAEPCVYEEEDSVSESRILELVRSVQR